MDQRKRVVAECLNAMADLVRNMDDADEEDLRGIVGGMAIQAERLALAALGIDDVPAVRTRH